MEKKFTKWEVGSIFPLPIINAAGSKILTLSKSLPIEEREANAQLICDSVNGTAGIGINPNGVKEMKEALEATTKELEYALYNHAELLRHFNMAATEVSDNTILKQAKQALKNSEL